MDTIIITVKTRGVPYDIEIPSGITAGRLLNDLAEAMDAYDKGQPIWLTDSSSLHCPRLGRKLRADEILHNAGIWEGDILEITEE